MMEYMMGWVNIGSSISLCPNLLHITALLKIFGRLLKKYLRMCKNISVYTDLYPTRSMTTSLCHVALHSAAMLATSITAWKITILVKGEGTNISENISDQQRAELTSGSSALTWKMGALTTLPTSVQYGLERE